MDNELKYEIKTIQNMLAGHLKNCWSGLKDMPIEEVVEVHRPASHQMKDLKWGDTGKGDEIFNNLIKGD